MLSVRKLKRPSSKGPDRNSFVISSRSTTFVARMLDNVYLHHMETFFCRLDLVDSVDEEEGVLLACG